MPKKSCATALEVLAAQRGEVMLAEGDEYTPTPVISHAISTYNRGCKDGLADGVVITLSHNPPHDGGFIYNPPNGGLADMVVTGWVEAKANELPSPGCAVFPPQSPVGFHPISPAYDPAHDSRSSYAKVAT
jgi:phosphoglucomutase